MPIVPDTKDWTWVVEARCADCGFDGRRVAATDVAGLVRANAPVWRPLLVGPDGGPRPGVGDRPSDDTWSALEYACHVRDVYRLYDRRLARMLTEDGPLFANWDQDVAAVEERYAEQAPGIVADELEGAAATIAASLDAVTGEQWLRRGERSDGARFTVDTFARYFIHDPIHHVTDVERGYARLGR
jgi:hypothetical protein